MIFGTTTIPSVVVVCGTQQQSKVSIALLEKDKKQKCPTLLDTHSPFPIIPKP
jgi:hypothetical protein